MVLPGECVESLTLTHGVTISLVSSRCMSTLSCASQRDRLLSLRCTPNARNCFWPTSFPAVLAILVEFPPNGRQPKALGVLRSDFWQIFVYEVEHCEVLHTAQRINVDAAKV